MSKKRAARQILNDNSPPYSGTVDNANIFFTRVFGEKRCNPDDVKRSLNDFVPSTIPDELLYAPITPEEAAKKLRSLTNSALGSDRVEYCHLCSVDPKCMILTSIFNRRLTECNVPDNWKTSSTIFIHKKGDASDVSNFQPIALMSCIDQLLMSIIASWLVSFSIDMTSFLTFKRALGPPRDVMNTQMSFSH